MGELTAAEMAHDNWEDGPSDSESRAFLAGHEASESRLLPRIKELEAELSRFYEFAPVALLDRVAAKQDPADA